MAQEPAKKQKIGIEIPVLNLDVNSRIEEVKQESRDDTERLENIEAVEKALGELVRTKGGEAAGKELLKERVKILHHILMMQLTEEEE